MNAKSISVGIICSVAMLLLFSLFWDFVLDDSFITYRYSQNLADGHGIVWNIGEDPVEGFTSFLWVILNAFAIRLKLDPVIFSKVISIISALVIIWLIAYTAEKSHWSLVFIFTAAIATCPEFAFLSMQGMETTLTCLLLTSTAVISIKVLKEPSPRYVWYWYTLALLSALSRPDTIPFNAGILVGLLGISIAKRNYPALNKLLKMGCLFAILAATYMTWRISYFGYTFPNTFYIKIGSFGIHNADGLNYAYSFVTKILFPYLIIIAFLAGKYWNKDKFFKIAPILTGLSFFGLYVLTIDPYVQGFFWRFIFPVYPPFLVAAAYYFSSFKMPSLFSGKIAKTSFALAVAIILTLWNIRLVSKVYNEQEFRTHKDRVAAGKALADIKGTMYISESGALPFYSGWKAVDELGLNSEEIAHNGLSEKLLVDLNPDLVMLVVYSESGKYAPKMRTRIILNDYMINHDYIAIAVIKKTKKQYHYYFANKQSKLFEKIATRMLNMPNVRYSNLEKMMTEKHIPTYHPTIASAKPSEAD